jgi:hypothetical protein
MSSTENEIVAPDVILMLWPKTDTQTIVEPQSTTVRLLHWNSQSFTPPQSLNSFVVHTPAFFARHHRDSTIAIARRQIGHSFHQPRFIIRDIQSPTLRRSRLTENATRSTFGNAITSLTSNAHARPTDDASPDSEVSRGGLSKYRLVQFRISQQLLQSSIFPVKFLQTPGLIGTNSAILLTPAIVRLVRNTDLAARFCNILSLRKKNLSFSKLLKNLFCLESLTWHRMHPHLKPNL